MLPSFLILLQDIRIILSAIVLIPLFLFVDSPAGDELLGNGQLVANVLIGIVFLVGLRRCNQRARDIMLIGIVIGLCGEILFSLVLNMYHYRLNNIPIWVGFGHGLIYAFVYRASRKQTIKKYEKYIQIALLVFASLFSIGWLIFENDWFGFLCTSAFLIILSQAKKSQTFFLIMFAVVAYIELVGTATQCWWWPNTLSGLGFTPESGNPPSGIAVFYFLFDAITFWLYLNIMHKRTKFRYLKIKNISV